MRFASHSLLLLVTLALVSLAAAAPAQLDARGQQNDKHPSHPGHPHHPPPPPPAHPKEHHPQAQHPHPAPPPPQPEHPHPHPHPQPHPQPHPLPPPPHPNPGPHPPTPIIPHTSTASTPSPTTPTSTTPSSTTTSSSTTSTSASGPTATGYLTFVSGTQAGQSYLREEGIDSDTAQLYNVGAPTETFSLDSSGKLHSSSGKTLYTDGQIVRSYSPQAALPSNVAPFSCVKDAASTATMFILDCTATTPDGGDVDTFVVCGQTDVEAAESACSGRAAFAFDQLVLATSSAPTGTLSYANAPNDNSFLGEAEDDEGDFYLKVSDPQSWTLSPDGSLFSPSGRALYSQGPSVVTYPPSDTVAIARLYHCTQNANSDAHTTILDCSAAGQSEFEVCSDGFVYDDQSTCTNLGNSVIMDVQQLTLTHG